MRSVPALTIPLIVAACAGLPPEPPEPLLAARPREKLAQVVPVQGVQLYECRAQDSSGFGWAAVGAELFDAGGRRFGRHLAPGTPGAPDGRGPENVQGRVTRQVAAPGLDAIPWQRIRVDTTSGAALLGDLASIHRTRTRGGLPPSARCSAAEAGTQAHVDYRADYEFYVVR